MKQLTKNSLKYMIELEILKAEESVTSAKTISDYSHKLIEYKKAKQLKQLVNELDMGNDHVISHLEKITKQAIV